MGRSGDPSRAEYGCDVEEENVPEAHLAAKLRDHLSMGLSQALRLPLAENKIPAADDRDSKPTRF